MDTTPHTSEPPEHIPYTVVSASERQSLLPNATFQTVHDVYFTGPNGYSGQVTVNDSDYTAAHVDNLIQAKLMQHAEVAQLGAQPHPDNLAQ